MSKKRKKILRNCRAVVKIKLLKLINGIFAILEMDERYPLVNSRHTN